MKKTLIGIAVVILAWMIGYVVGRNREPMTEVITQLDTLIVRDTIVREKPKEVAKWRTDTIYVAVSDTITLRDTTFIVLPREMKEYRSDDYLARVSGYEPCLDYIEVYPKTAYITKTETIKQKEKKNSIGIGIEANYSNAMNLPIQLEYSRQVLPWFSIYGYWEYELIRKNFGVGIGTQISIGF